MIYFKIGTMIVAALGLLIYTFIFDKKYFFLLFSIDIILAGILSFYVFYKIGNYTDSSDDVILSADCNKAGKNTYTLKLNTKWEKKPEIFGINGSDDLLVIRYNPEFLEIVSSDKPYKQTKKGKSTIKLDKEFKYYNMESNEQEISYNIKDGEDAVVEVDFKELKPEGVLKVFYIHDYKIPFAESVFWEKIEEIEVK